MARGALALPSLLLLLLAALPTAQASLSEDASALVDLSSLTDGDADGCIGPKLRGDQALVAHAYPGGGFEVFAGVDPGTASRPLGAVAAGDVDGIADTGGDYVGVGAYALGPGCEMPDVVNQALA